MILKMAQLFLFSSYLSWVGATVDLFNSVGNSHKGHIRQKKKIFLREPYRGGNNDIQVPSNYQHSSTVSSMEEYSYGYSSPGENVDVSWKPITQRTVYVTSGDLENDSSKLVKNGMNVLPSDTIDHIDHNKNAQRERIVFGENNSVLHRNGANSGQATTAGYALFHYYIPIEQLPAIKFKPIKEQIIEAPMKPIVIEELIKDSIAPLPVFPTTSSKVSLPVQPSPPEHTSTTPAATISAATTNPHKYESKDLTDDENVRYEYEYFIQDDYHGTNFGHKEYRDGKNTKGDYEVVLPDGRVQYVRYFSDATGYHATVTYHPINKKIHVR